MISRAVPRRSASHERLADVLALREQESIGHGAADDQHIHLVEQIAQQVELGRNLGAADDRCERPLRVFQRLASASSSACIVRPA